MVGTTGQLTASRELEFDAAISPDGRLIAYVMPVNGVPRVAVRPVTGGDRPVVVADSGGPQRWPRWPRWSPDGSQLVFASRGTVLLTPALGGTPRALTEPDDRFLRRTPTPAFSPDGGRIAYVAGNRAYVMLVGNSAPSRIWSVDTAGGTPVPLTEGTHLATSPVWTPAGRRVLYVSNVGGRATSTSARSVPTALQSRTRCASPRGSSPTPSP